MSGFISRVKSAWNAFLDKSPTMYSNTSYYSSGSYSRRPDRTYLSSRNERSIVTSIYNRISLDVSSAGFRHVLLDKDKKYLNDAKSNLNNALTIEANIDQIPRSFLQDLAVSCMDEGVVAVVPIDATADIMTNDEYDIYSFRTAKIVEWLPSQVKVYIYNDITGTYEYLLLPKSKVAIIENPYYSIMNAPNSTLNRLINKLTLLDKIDENNGSNKLDMIIQLPYSVKTPMKKQIAKERVDDIKNQLSANEYGIAYTDSTEKITQLNRPVENQLLSQIEFLTNQLMSQLGITTEILNGSADASTMANYYSRTIDPFLNVIAEEFRRKFLSRRAIKRGESIMFFRDLFKLCTVDAIAEAADKLTRNEIATSNEIRQLLGWLPSKDPSADELRNKNISSSTDEVHVDKEGETINNLQGGINQNG